MLGMLRKSSLLADAESFGSLGINSAFADTKHLSRMVSFSPRHLVSQSVYLSFLVQGTVIQAEYFYLEITQESDDLKKGGIV